jgi:hypothetical protein
MEKSNRKRKDSSVRIPAVQQPVDGDGTDIARRAYELFEARGGDHGHDVEDWLEAERELRRA